MARTPRQETITVPAGGRVTLQISGKWLTILSNTAASVDVSFDNDAFMPMVASLPYPASDGAYDRVTFLDTLGAGCTLTAIFAYEQTPDTRGSGLTVAMAASLAAIDADTTLIHVDCGTTIPAAIATIPTAIAELEPPDTGGLVALGAVAQTGVGSTQIVTAAAANKRVLIQADHDNTGSVYLGFANTVTAANSFARLLPGDSWQESFAGNVWACSENGTEQVRAYVLSS